MTNNLKNNTVLNMIKTIFSIVFPLITFPYVSRVLLPDNVGKVNWANSYVSYFSLIASLGVSTYAIRTCSQVKYSKEKLSKAASEVFSINLITTIVAYILLIFSLVFIRRLDYYRDLVIISSTSIIFTTIGADYINSAMEDFKYITIRTIIYQMILLVLTFLLVRDTNDYYKYMLITVLSTSAVSISNFFYRKKFCIIRFTLNIDWKTHMPPILMLFSMSLSQVIFNNADVTMLGIMWSDHEVGLYSTAHKMTNTVAQIVQSIILVILPRLSYYFAQEDYVNINKLLKKVLSFNIGLGLPCVVGILMTAEDITYIIGGDEFMAAAPVMRILILSFMFSLVGGSFLGNAILIPSKNEKYYMFVCWITAVCNVILNFILIPSLGATGAAISTAFNGLLIFLLLLFKIDKKIKIPRMQSAFTGPLVGCIGIMICCFICSFIDSMIIRISISILSSIAVYGGILITMKNEFAIEVVNTIAKWFKRN